MGSQEEGRIKSKQSKNLLLKAIVKRMSPGELKVVDPDQEMLGQVQRSSLPHASQRVDAYEWEAVFTLDSDWYIFTIRFIANS